MKLVPSILFNNVFDPISRKEQIVMDYFKKIIDINYYESIETRIIFDEKVRKEFAELTLENNLSVTIWTVSTMNDQGYSLSDLDETKRKEAVAYLKMLIDMSKQQNAAYVGFNSGKIIREDQITSQLQQFKKSLTSILEHVKKYPEITLTLEPLDVKAHKKMLIGTSETVKEITDELSVNNLMSQFSITLDTAHIMLNEEDILESFKLLAPVSNRIHLANVVEAKDSPLYGDFHMNVGEPGYLTQDYAKEILQYAKELKFQDERVYVALEVRSKEGIDLFESETDLRSFLAKAIGKLANS